MSEKAASLLPTKAEKTYRRLRQLSVERPTEFRQLVLSIMESSDFPLSLQNDNWIRSKCVVPEIPRELDGEMIADPNFLPMISPFQDRLIAKTEKQVNYNNRGDGGTRVEKRLSFGVTGFGYDVTLAPNYKIFSAENALAAGVSIIDPKAFRPEIYLECEAKDDKIVMPPKSFILARINEYIRMPPNALAILLNKSTYARCGVTVTTTVMEPGWHGEIVVEITNDAPLPVILYANEGIGQLIFLTGDQPSEHYGSRNAGKGGKYQGQTGITEPKV